jgi:PTS system fructose-specific IIA component/PTS system nitrogen regulatory IIA component
MKLSEIITVVLDDLSATDKNGVISEMVDGLVERDMVDAESREKVSRALKEREKIGSTGIGKGIAVPHAKHDSVDRLIGAFARSPKGVNFDALDGEPVYLVFMLLSNKALTSQHLDALKCIARFLREDTFCKFLRQAKSKEEIFDLFKEADAKLGAA